jgi:hypothetical protein
MSKESSFELLKRVKQMNLINYYNFRSEEFWVNNIKGVKELKEILRKPKLLRYNEETEGFTYLDENEIEKDITELAKLNDFSQTNPLKSLQLIIID